MTLTRTIEEHFEPETDFENKNTQPQVKFTGSYKKRVYGEIHMKILPSCVSSARLFIMLTAIATSTFAALLP